MKLMRLPSTTCVNTSIAQARLVRVPLQITQQYSQRGYFLCAFCAIIRIDLFALFSLKGVLS